MLKEKEHQYVKFTTAGPLPVAKNKKSLYRKWNQMPRCQRKLILLIILISFFVLFLILTKLQAQMPDVVEDNVIDLDPNDGVEKNEVQIKLSAFGKKEDQIESEQARKELQEYLIRKQEEMNEFARAVALLFQKILEKETGNTVIIIGEPTIFKGPQNKRQRAVVAAFSHAWKGYKEFAWGHDNLQPVSKGYYDWFGLGLTIIDSLDTMYIMDLKEEFEDAKNWVESSLKLETVGMVSFYEVTIRMLGGLLSAFHFSSDDMFLSKAMELGHKLLPCFNNSTTGIPHTSITLGTNYTQHAIWMHNITTSEVTSFQLEFNLLSWVTNNRIYEELSTQVNDKVHNFNKTDGLVFSEILRDGTGFSEDSTITAGTMVDSYIEYLLKQWIQNGKKRGDALIEDYKNIIDGVIKKLMKTSPNEKHMYIGELFKGKIFIPKMDHLACFLPGTLLLGFSNGMPLSHLTLAEGLLDTCYQIYMKQVTHLAPERVHFNENVDNHSDIYVKPSDAYNLLRPDFIESLYYFYAITGKKSYQDMGWNVFNAIERYAKVENGYTSIGNVTSVTNTKPKDMMESFFLSETLKYFYLLFSDDRKEINLDKFVFNTEGHPLPVID